MRPSATWAVAGLLALAVAAALWALRPFRDLPEVVPQDGGAAAGAGAAIAVVGLVLVAAAAAALVWAIRRDFDRAVRLVVHAAIAFGLLLLLVPLVLLALAAGAGVPGAAAWLGAGVLAAGLAWLLRDGWRAQVAAALAAGGFAGMAAGVGRLAILAVVAAALALYDAWAVRRDARGSAPMAAAAAAADKSGAPLTVGSAPAGLSLGLGDLLVPAALVASAAAHGWLPLALGVAGLGLGLALLARAVAGGKDAPGIPYLAGGALGGIALGLALGPLAS